MSAYCALGDAFRGVSKSHVWPVEMSLSRGASSLLLLLLQPSSLLLLLPPPLALFDAFTNTHSPPRRSLSSRACRTL